MHGILTDLTLAYRSVLRQRRRSGFALSAIAVGVAALILAGGFIEWNFVHYRETMINTQLGHLQIHRSGFTRSGASDPFRYLLPENSPELAVIRAMPSVRRVAPRLSVSGLVSHGDATLPFIAEGIDPALEGGLAESLMIVAGEALAANDPAGVLIGQGLATNLGVRPGDGVVIVANTDAGGINAIDARVRGVFTTVSKAYDEIALRLPIDSARRLLKIRGSHTWVVLLDDTGSTQSVLSALARTLPAERYEIVPWWSLSDFYNKSSALFSRQSSVMKVIIGMLIVLSISNTLMMSVIERTGEIGTSMALGTPRRRLLRQFLAEAVVIGVMGTLLGIVVGALLATLVSAIGIPVPPPPGMGHGYTGRIQLTGGLLATAAVLAIATTILAALYPSWKASRLVIVDALRRNR